MADRTGIVTPLVRDKIQDEMIRTVSIDGKTLDQMAEEAARILQDRNDPPQVFRHGAVLVRIGHTDDDYPVIVPWQVAGFKKHLSSVVQFVRFDKRTREVHPTPCAPEDVVKSMLQLADHWDRIPVVDTVVQAPVVAPTGELVTTPGYSPAAQVWYEPDPLLTIPPVPDRPTAAETAAARDLILNDLLGDFPFATAADRALAFALVLLPFVRPLINEPTPMHAINAPTPGTGKGMCARACLLPGFGPQQPAIPPVSDEGEMAKQLGSIFLGGRSLVRFDNVVGRLDSPSLSMALTEPVWQRRILGLSKDMQIPIKCVWVLTGNNVEMSGEIARRSPHIDLDVTTAGVTADIAEHPWRRTRFRQPDLLRWATANRGTLIHAALVIIRSWQQAGSQHWTGTPLGSYEDWSRIMGGLVEHIGGTAFLTNLEDTYEATVSDGERECDFVSRWATRFGVGNPVSTTELRTMSILECGDPFDVTGGGARSESTRFGLAMKRLSGQVRCGLRVMKRRDAWVLQKYEAPGAV